MSDIIKRSLLLTHGTIYGTATPDTLFKGYEGVTTSITNGWTVPWRTNLYLNTVITAGNFRVGPMTKNEPIDVIHWAAGPGKIHPSGLEWWQQCLTLFMRHI